MTSPPGNTTFSFGTAWVGAEGEINISYVDDLYNTAGAVQQIAKDAFTITMQGAGTVKGYIVIEGYAENLDGLQLSVWENLAPYANVQDAKNAYWTYDETAWNNMLRWNVTLKADGYELDYDIALENAGGKSEIAFENLYEEMKEPDLPQTGDNSKPILLGTMLLFSLGGLFMMNRKKRND